jgi:AcrR family transcriptional regulator
MLDGRITHAAVELYGEAGWVGFNVESVARRAGVGKASVYLRWKTKETLLVNALAEVLTPTADVDTGTLRGDLIELAAQQLRLYLGPGGRAALRISLDAGEIPDVAAQAGALRSARVLAARKIVRRGVARGDVSEDTPVTLLLDTLCGGAAMHVGATPPELREQLVTGVDRYARQLVDFLLASIAVEKKRSR